MNDDHTSAGIASIAAHERAAAAAARLDAEREAARPAPPAIADRPGRAERKAAESVRCPFCKSAPGQHCTAAGRHTMQKPHPGRIGAYAVQAVACPECAAGVGAGCHCASDPYFRDVHAGRVEAALAAARAVGRQA